MEDESNDVVNPLKGVMPWLGGKHRLAKRIIGHIEAMPHTAYVEPFMGAGGVFFRRPHRVKCEVVNDINREITTLYRVLQRHHDALMEMLELAVASRADFERLKFSDPETLTDIERAARFYFLGHLAFGGRSKNPSFGTGTTTPARFKPSKALKEIRAFHARLDGVVIECLPYGELIARYDRPHTLFYLDPPYFGGEKDYGTGLFDRMDFARLADQLGQIEGRFILSINDRPEIREIFAGFRFEEVSLSYSVSKGKSTKARELIIMDGRS